MLRRKRELKTVAYMAAALMVLAAGAVHGQESYGDMERRLYLKPRTSPMEKPARRVAFHEGDFGKPADATLSLDGQWSVLLQDGLTISADVPCSIYTALWKAGAIGDPYFGTNDLFAATFSGQTSVWSRVFAFSPKHGARYRLSFDGVVDEAEFTLNGRALGRHVGMFGGPDFVLRSEDFQPENTLSVKLLPVRRMEDDVSCQAVRGWHYCNLPSMGIWQSVSLTEIPEAEVRRQFVVTRSAGDREMDYRVDIDAMKAVSGELRLSVCPVGFAGVAFAFSERVDLEPGENSLRYRFALPGAELWWPAGHGASRTYEITASFGESSRTDEFGIRTFRFVPGPKGARTNLYNRVAEVNGRRLFLKGAGWCTCDALLRFDEARYCRMIGRAVEQGVNFFRAWGAGLVETDVFYRQCDRAGIMVLQEFPVPGDHSSRKIHTPLLDTAERSVVRLRNHPSLVAWGGGNELALKRPEFGLDDELINGMGRICCELDGTRDFWRTDPWAGSVHPHIAWSGWMPDRFLRHYADREGVCLNEYGLDAPMNVESLRRISTPEEHDMFPWRRYTAMAHHTATFNYDFILHDSEKATRGRGRDTGHYQTIGSRYLPQNDIASYVLAAQVAQIYSTAYHVYNARTQFPYTGMEIYYKLNDVYPGSSWAVVDWFGAPKPAHYALKRAQRPLCAAPRLVGHEFGERARMPFYVLDDAGELRADSRWEVAVRFFDKGLGKPAERKFSGTGPVGSVFMAGEAESDPARPLTSPSVVAWELSVDGKVRTRDFVMVNVYDSPEKCAGFAHTELRAALDGDGRCVVSNVGNAAAVGVMLDLGKDEDKAVVEDNFFFLPAGESRAISVSPPGVVKGVSALNSGSVRCRTATRQSLPRTLFESAWIGDGEADREEETFYDEDPAPEFSASFVLPEGVGEAKVVVACAGYYALSLNGRPSGVSATSLMPLWSPFDRTVYADSFVARVSSGDLLPHPATNVVAVTLGNGFYNLPPIRFWGSKCFRDALAHGRPCFKLAIDGVKGPLAWRRRTTNVVRNCVYLGAEVDATRPVDAAWKPASRVPGPRGAIVPRTAPPVVYTGTVEARAVRTLADGSHVVDFGANLSGVPVFEFRDEPRGNRIEIVYGERLNADGSVNVLTQTAGQVKRAGMGGKGAPALACQRDAYVCSGNGVERFEPPFVWHICRYAEVRGAKSAPRATLRTVSSDLASVAPGKGFLSADPKLQAIHEVCVRTFRDNLIGVQSDCPGRERLGYGGDIAATCEAMCLNFDMLEFYLKTLQDFADEAEGDGWITETAPFVGIADSDGLEAGGASRRGPVSWALAVPVLMETLLRHYPQARSRILAFYPVCARYVRKMAAKYPSGIVPRCIGDHEALERAPNEVTATAHYHEFVRLTAGFARAAGREADVREFVSLADRIKAAFRRAYVKGGVVANGTQSAQSIGLYLGLVDDVPAAEAQLLKAVAANGFAPTTGIFSTRYMLMYLAEHGHNDVARRIVLHEGFPGWLHMLERGATTLWETWKESDNVYSNCHPMFGSVDEWILKHGRGESPASISIQRRMLRADPEAGR